MRLLYVFLPALLVDIDATFGAVIDMDSGFFATNRAVHGMTSLYLL